MKSHNDWRGKRTISYKGVLTKRLSPQGRWTQGGVPARTLGPEKRVDEGVPPRLEKGTGANEDVGSRRGWIVRSHIGWTRKRSILYKSVLTRRLSPERGGHEAVCQQRH